MAKIWRKIVRSLARGDCQIGKNESMRKLVEKKSRKKSGRKISGK